MALTLDLVPSSTWYDNLRSRLRPSEWDRLRKATYAAAGNKCEVCGGNGRRHPVECHERWTYDEDARVQRLVGLVALCPACHEVKHFGRAQSVGRGAPALAHLMRVNRWTEDQALDHIEDSFRVWQRRSAIEWTLDLSWLDTAAAEHPVRRPHR
ncbi:MAG: HNH endonuclease [Actinobacteria bacterium]|nr:HNH endonuclease [Actinomycetota bacterium]NBR66156.1 HNH endonuclease [Actinomycetota bacterium]